jgi:S-phase kinase-associated protein 1
MTVSWSPGAESGTDDSISVQMVPGKVLAKVLQYCKHHADDTGKVVDTDRASEDTEGDEDAISNWDKEFLDVDQGTLFSIIRVRFLRPAPACTFAP